MATSYMMHVISNTHWDREWRYSFQETRMMLVDMLDKVLRLLESDPEFKYFHLDSQTSVVDDYLQIRPENEGRLRTLVQNGRLLIGPWYCLPDQFMVGGEALVRNLLLGHKIASRFGKIMKVGYSPFSWGQISQLPQLYAGFGIDSALFYRGVSKTDTGQAEFIWEGADGTHALASRFSKLPRCNFWYDVYRAVVFNREWGVDDREYHWEMPGVLCRFCDEINFRRDYKLADPPDEYHRDRLKDSLVRLCDIGKEDFTTQHLFWAQGHDISAPSHRESQLIREANELLPDDTVIHSNLPDYIKALRESIGELRIVKGEMRSVKKDARSSSLAGHVISARMYIKQANYETESLLTTYTEPFAVFNWMSGTTYPQRFLELAWRYLLDNHGHDSIGGCSVDIVHQDMLFRYRQANEIARGLIERNYLFLAASIDFSNSDPRDINLVVVNPTQYERDEVVMAYVDVPIEWSGGYAIDPEPLTLYMQDDRGESVAVQPISDRPEFPVLQQPIDSPLFLRMSRHQMCFPTGKVPPFGYRCFKVTADFKKKRLRGSLVTGNNTMENEHLRVTINANGTWNIYDKANATEYRDLGYLWDGGEVGDPWEHISPNHDRIFTSTSLNARVSLDVDGPLMAQFSVYLKMDVPASATDGGRQRSDQTLTLEVKHTLSLAKDSPRLNVITEIENQCEDHWLRLLFPTDLEAQHVAIEGQFDVIERPIPRTEDTSEWLEPPLHPQPMNSFVDYSDGSKGMAFINYGLKEYEAFDDRRRTFAMTLLRAYPLKIGGVGMQDYSKEQKGSQCLGRHVYRYALYPHTGDWEQGAVFNQTSGHNCIMNVFQVGKNRGTWQKQRSFLKLEPSVLVITGIKRAEQDEAFVIRFFNPTKRKIEGTLRFDFDIASAICVTLEEKAVAACQIKGSVVKVEVGAKKIITIKIYRK
ncbi:hypothetical protein JXJ21_15160 [candidate division KSB1 bacterium]|nr:hypothetical protein [candidate division KSB1 bacterium]